MPDAAPYAYAKACGIIGKSYIGKRISSLAGLRSLNELDRLIFPESHGELSRREMLVSFEKRIIARTIHQILLIMNGYDKPPELLVRLLRVYEYSDLKLCLQSIAGGEKTIPQICDIGDFGVVRFKEYPDASGMLYDTEFSFLISEELGAVNSGSININSIETKLDNLFYRGLINCLLRLSQEDRQIINRILCEEISLRNCVWALRLRTYYQKSAKETAGYLMNIEADYKTEKNYSLAEDAAESLEFPLDTRNSWEGWKWETLLNKENPNEHWTANPRYFQNAASQYLYRLTLRSFHRCPMSLSSIFCFIKLKQFEEDFIISIAEGLTLGMESAEIYKLLEASV